MLFFVHYIFSPLITTAAERESAFGKYFDQISKKEKSIFAASIVGIESENGDISSLETGAFGKQNIIADNTPMTTSTSFRTNTLSEIFIDITVAYLESSLLLPFSRLQKIPPEFLPPPYDKNSPFINPAFPETVITLNDLLLHTSSLTEEGFNKGEVKTPGPAKGLKEFVEDLFAGSAENLWGASRPGLSSSYNYSRINTALVTYILEKVLAKMTKPVSVATFVQTKIIAPLALTNTFLLDVTGSAPLLSYPPGDVADLSARAVQDVTHDGSKLLGAFTIHAAYASDYMYYTSTQDLAKLAFNFFLDGRFTALGALLRTSTIELQNESLTAPGAISRSFGVYNFDPVKLCEEINLCSVGCDFGKDDRPFGWVIEGEHNQVALLCLQNACVAAEVSYYSEFQAKCSYALSFAALSFTQKRNKDFFKITQLYPLYVFIGVLSAIIAVIVGSYITDYFVQPTTGRNALQMDQINTEMSFNSKTAQPNNSERIIQSNDNRYSKWVSSPVPTLDIYNK